MIRLIKQAFVAVLGALSIVAMLILLSNALGCQFTSTVTWAAGSDVPTGGATVSSSVKVNGNTVAVGDQEISSSDTTTQPTK